MKNVGSNRANVGKSYVVFVQRCRWATYSKVDFGVMWAPECDSGTGADPDRHPSARSGDTETHWGTLGNTGKHWETLGNTVAFAVGVKGGGYNELGC